MQDRLTVELRVPACTMARWKSGGNARQGLHRKSPARATRAPKSWTGADCQQGATLFGTTRSHSASPVASPRRLATCAKVEAVPTEPDKIELSEHEVREIAGYAADCARRASCRSSNRVFLQTRALATPSMQHGFSLRAASAPALRQSGWAAYRAAHEAASPGRSDTSGKPKAPALRSFIL
jgi:hypothetical protein